ncbi:MAG: cobalamin-dependent protein [Thermoplasmatales archaeon]|nr:cobalamin-dependent protein [Thermoplasmatales archaeon]
MKVVLTTSPTRIKGTKVQPLGLAYLAASAEQAGHKIKIIDAMIMNYSFEDIHKEIAHFDPDVLGATSWTQNIYDVLKIIKRSKENNPNCISILGGSHSSLMAKDILNENEFVDIIVRGEGEKTFVEILEKIEKNQDYSVVDGITFRNNGKVIENKNRENIKDLDILPLPAYHLLPMKEYTVKYRPFDYEMVGDLGDQYCAISTCRGCPYNCIFCSSRALWGRNWRARSAQNVIEEIKILNDKYKVKVIDFMDDTGTIDKKRILKICKLIKKENFDVLWTAGTRVDLFDKEIAKSFKTAGCSLARLAPESGNQRSLDFLQKSFTIEDVKRAIKIAKDAELNTSGNFIIGIPGENRKMINQTISFAKKLNLTHTTFSILDPLPGTKIYDIAVQNNLLLTKDWSKYTPMHSVLKLKNFNPKELEKLLIKAFLICCWINPRKSPKILKRDLIQLLKFKKRHLNV